MALKATVFKAELQVSDLDRHYYATHNLTLARHPSETDERMMARLIAFALFADEALQFTKGLCEDDEPELWQKNLSDEIELWVELGHPDEKRLRKACARGRQAVVICYSGSAAEIWWQGVKGKAHTLDNLQVINLPALGIAALAALVERSMRMQVTIQDGELWIGLGEGSVELTPEHWQ